MKLLLKTAVGLLALVFVSSRADATPVAVPGMANPWLADATTASGGDTAPDESPVIVNLVDFVPGDALSFGATGSVSYGGGEPTDLPDGNIGFFIFHLGDSTNGGPENGLAGLNAPANALVAAFVGPTIPVPGPTPQPFLNFASNGNVPNGIDYTTLAPELNQPFFIGDGVTSTAVAQQVVVPAGATRLVLGSMDGSGWFNNSGSFSVEIALASDTQPTPTPPPHGGLSATQFTVNGSSVNTTGAGKDTVLKFAAVQTGNPAGLKVRVQASGTPNIESSWVDLPNGSGGYMTRDETTGFFVLNNLNYPLQNGMHFRALASAPGYADSISNVVGFYDLATSTAHVVPVTLFLATNGPGQEIKFHGKLMSALSGTTLRVQATTTPGDEASWADLADGNGGAMFPYAEPTLFYLTTKKYPPGNATYFRIVASHAGRVDSISNFVGVEHTVVGTAPEMEILPPIPEPGSGSGLTPLDPIIVSTGTITFGVQLATSGTLSELGLLYDGTVLETRNGGTSFTLPYFTTVGGDHVITGYGINSAGIKGFAPPVYIRIKPPNGKIFTRTSSGAWNDSTKWKDGLGAAGVPSANDVAVIPFCTVDITQNISVYAIALNSATLHGAGGGLTINQFFNITGSASLKDLNTTVTSSGTVALWSDANVPMSGSWINYGTFKMNGRGSIVAVPPTGSGTALGVPAPNGFLDGALTAITNFGKWIVAKLSTPPPPSAAPARDAPGGGTAAHRRGQHLRKQRSTDRA